MRIAILTDSFLPYLSGVTTYCIELARELTKNGHRVLILAPNYPGDNLTVSGLEKVKVIRTRSVPTMVKNFRTSIPNAAKVIRELKKFKADIVETENPVFLGLDGLISSKILGIPCVSVFHTLATSKEYLELIFKSKSPLLEKAVWIYHQKFYGSSDRVFVFTTDVYNLLVKQGVKRNKIDIVSTFFDYYNTKILNKSERKVLKKYYNLKSKVAVYLGRISPEKNLDTLIKIWKGVVNEFPNSSLLIIGGGIYEKNLRSSIKKEKLGDNVILLGAIEHEHLLTSGLLSICDVFISASVSETFGLTGIEAMAHKLPVVLFKTQGLAEIVDNSGIVCKPNDVKSFKEGILKLFRNDKLRRSMGKKARIIASKYNSEKQVKKIIDKYRETIKNYRPSKGSLNYLKKLSKIELNFDRYKQILKSL